MNISKFHNDLLGWYKHHQRPLPWRDPDGQPMNPYAVWISEIMLQQTVVATVRPYFISFINQWPDVSALAQAPLDAVLHQWQGLGYYSRARNLHKCAQVIVSKYNSVFPASEAELLSLPGIGPYTAAAIMSIAYNQSSTVIDGNIERVVSRLFKIEIPLPDAKKIIKSYAAEIRSETYPSQYAQALMDLGALICTPKSPKCLICPVSDLCPVKGDGAARYPLKPVKQKRPIRQGIFYWITNKNGAVLLKQRPSKGLFGRMYMVPSSGWDPLNPCEVDVEQLRDCKIHPTTLHHIFTHFTLKGEICMARCDAAEGIWVNPRDLKNYPLPTVMRKIIKVAAQEGLG